MGSAFLSQPNTTKKISKHQHGKLRVVTCEMQGKKYCIKVGANTWKMLLSFIALVKTFSCLLSLMAMEGFRSLNIVLNIFLRLYKIIELLVYRLCICDVVTAERVSCAEKCRISFSYVRVHNMRSVRSQNIGESFLFDLKKAFESEKGAEFGC